jgi:SAM-dependent methyltransferase
MADDDLGINESARQQPPAIDTTPRPPKVDAMDLAPAPHPLTNAEWCEWIYANAAGDLHRVPWARSGADGLLLKWLNSEAPRLVRPGCRAVVIGCGLGDDVAEMAHRGFDVIGFDVSPTAVQWAARRHPSCAQRFLRGDLLDLPFRLVGRFDLVVEVCTLQSLAPELRPTGAANIARLATSRGVVVVVSCGRPAGEEDDDLEGPPWPLSTRELESVMAGAGLGVVGGVRAVPCDNQPDHLRVMGTFVRG